MPEYPEKLRPDRDLQCYFERPSAIAALSDTAPDRFTVSGTWRQQFDWAVIEWNRDNTFEHPLFRNLPDGDLSGLTLTYEETRENCIPLDSTLYPTVDWPYLRIWAEQGGVETLYWVPLRNYATPVEGFYTSASASFTLLGTATEGDFVGLAWQGEHHTHRLFWNDTIATTLAAIEASVTAFSPIMAASVLGTTITLHYVGLNQLPATSTTGANGNRIGTYGHVAGAKTESWAPAWRRFSGGTSPTKWRVTLPFSSLIDVEGRPVPTSAIRKMRWTYSADLQPGTFQPGEFRAVVSNWSVAGSGRAYQVAGPGSRRVEDDSNEVVLSGAWTDSRGNFSGGSIRLTTSFGSSVTHTYSLPHPHRLYLGTRKAESGAVISISVDGLPPRLENLALLGEDVLLRIPLYDLPGQVPHAVTVTHAGPPGSPFYFDFLEMAVPAAELPTIPPDPQTTLATDWDTDHSIALAPERTAWMIHSLGFLGRANHYVGALWFYELHRPGQSYATATVEFTGAPSHSQITTLVIGSAGSELPPTTIEHLNLVGDTAETIARAFELEINSGYTGIWVELNDTVLTVHARAMGIAGESVTISASPTAGAFSVHVSSATLLGGEDGNWRTDLQATPRLNRAVRDWSRSFYKALKAYGIDVAAAFSMELQHGDPSPEAGIASRYPSGAPVTLNTPALHTNFSPQTTAFYREVYRDMAGILVEAGVQPYLQFGEVQWWYFAYDPSGMPFYDAYTTSTFASIHGRPMHVFVNNTESPDAYPEEAQFLPGLIGAFTNDIMDFVRQSYPSTRFEVLYPPDVNDFPLTRVVNLPLQDWTPSRLDCFKTENFTFTGWRDMNKSRESILLPMQLGFPRSKSSHLVGIGDYTTPWLRETNASKGEAVESVVLFALDQFCLIGFPVPLHRGSRRSGYQG
ncbi:MAG: hypothetical protein WD696_16485 [Bryobacteraceae bacterium]